MIVRFLSLAALGLFSFNALAAPAAYSLAPNRLGKSGVDFKIGYSAGTHVGQAGKANGELTLDVDNIAATTGLLTVPLANMVTGDTKRDCHMREALGIKYEGSVYPKEHACDSNHQLPPTGPNSIAFPNIEFALDGVRAEGKLVVGVPTNVIAVGKWLIHGVVKDAEISAVATLTATGEVELVGVSNIKLSDFGIIVKKFLVITVKDNAQVELNLLFKKK